MVIQNLCTPIKQCKILGKSSYGLEEMLGVIIFSATLGMWWFNVTKHLKKENSHWEIWKQIVAMALQDIFYKLIGIILTLGQFSLFTLAKL